MNKVKEAIIKAWKNIRSSKLNIGMFVTGVIAFALLIAIVSIIIFRGDGITNELIVTGKSTDGNTEETKGETETTTEENNETEEYSTKIDESATTNIVNSAELLKVNTSIRNSWIDDGEYFIQYNIDVTNVSERDIDGWALILEMSSGYSLVDSWNFNYKEGSRQIIINPTNDNKEIEAGDTVSGGFIVKGSRYVYINYYTSYVGSKTETIRISNSVIPQTTTKRNTQTTTVYDDITTTKKQVISETTTVGRETTTMESITSTTNETTSGESRETTTTQRETGTTGDVHESESTTVPPTTGETATKTDETTNTSAEIKETKEN